MVRRPHPQRGRSGSCSEYFLEGPPHETDRIARQGNRPAAASRLEPVPTLDAPDAPRLGASNHGGNPSRVGTGGIPTADRPCSGGQGRFIRRGSHLSVPACPANTGGGHAPDMTPAEPQNDG